MTGLLEKRAGLEVDSEYENLVGEWRGKNLEDNIKERKSERKKKERKMD